MILREGKKAWQDKARPHIFRDESELEVNELWCADHRRLDIFCWPPEGARKAIRPWVTAIIDVRSAAWVGWTLWLTPSSDTIACALRRAIMTYGVPKTWYRDNGKDFQAKRFGQNASSYRGVDWDEVSRWPAVLDDPRQWSLFKALGVQTIDALPYQAWSKPIESLFGAWSKRYERLLPGWCGSDAKAKPEKLAGEIQTGRILPWAELVALFERSVVDWNTGEPIGDRELSPINHYVEGSYTPRMVNQNTLTILLARHKRMRVHNHGVQLYGDKQWTYMCKELAPFIGCDAEVRWDPWQPDAIWVHPEMGVPDEEFPSRFHCEAWIKVPRCALGSYRQFGDEEVEAARARKQQRLVVGMRAEEAAGAASINMHDPMGGFQIAAAHQARVQADLAARAEPAALPAAPGELTDGKPVEPAGQAEERDEWDERRRARVRAAWEERQKLLDD